MNTKQISKGQVKSIAQEITKRWRFENRSTHYNCIDTKTGQQSVNGGDYNFASYYFRNKVKDLYLKMIGENSLYFDYMSCGVKIAEEREVYVLRIECEIVRLLCGYVVGSNKNVASALC